MKPCLPTNSQSVPTGPQWIYGIKHDGFRFICRRDGDRVRVFSRCGNDYTDRASGIAPRRGGLHAAVTSLCLALRMSLRNPWVNGEAADPFLALLVIVLFAALVVGCMLLFGR